MCSLDSATDQIASCTHKPQGGQPWSMRWASRPTRRSAAATSRSAASAPASSWPTCISPPMPRPASRWWRSPRARQDKAAEVAKRWGIGRVHATPEALIEDPEVEILDIAFPPDQQPDLIRHALQAAARQGDPGAEAAGAWISPRPRRRGGVPGRRQAAVGQPEHALRPVDARAQAAPGPRRAGRAGDRDDRDAGDPALAALPAAITTG